jgi:hypothetical protein
MWMVVFAIHDGIDSDVCVVHDGLDDYLDTHM